ncbi:MAG: DUF1993 domain-containing protein [Myxococcales bacterium]|nr:MAG: DUF1993 domain-containing protein [Myxococcales bacterium]
MYNELFGQMKKQLHLVNAWFDAAEAHAKEKSYDTSVLVAARLAPDQLPLARQVQIACDTLKLGASRVTGKDAPSQPDNEQTLGELRARIQSVITYLDGYAAKDFEGSADRVVTNPRWEGKTMTGADYFLEHVVPNFYFHLSHIYALLRHNGVNVGKRDYLGAYTMKG